MVPQHYKCMFIHHRGLKTCMSRITYIASLEGSIYPGSKTPCRGFPLGLLLCCSCPNAFNVYSVPRTAAPPDTGLPFYKQHRCIPGIRYPEYMYELVLYLVSSCYIHVGGSNCRNIGGRCGTEENTAQPKRRRPANARLPFFNFLALPYGILSGVSEFSL